MLITIPEDMSSRGRLNYHQPLTHSTSAPIRRNSDDGRKTRVLRLLRPQSNSYGFHLRGGREHGTGFFISHVEVGSEAYAQGLRTGDQVIRVNNHNISRSLHREVASIVQTSREVFLEVKSTGLIPVKNNPTDPLSWVLVNSKDHDRNSSLESQPYSLKSFTSSSSGGSNTPLSAPLFIVMSGAGKNTIGCSICKGPPEKPGIFIQRIIEKGVADDAGLRPGDQILSCNGKSFLSIEFQQAVQLMKSAPCLRLEVLRGAGMDLVAGESSGYNSSVSSEGEETYPSSESDSYRDIYSQTRTKVTTSLVSEKNSLYLDSNRDWKEIEAEWADAEVSEKRTRLEHSTLFSRQYPTTRLPPSKSLLSLTIKEDEDENCNTTLRKSYNRFGDKVNPSSESNWAKLIKPRSLSDLRAPRDDLNYKIALQTSSDAHVSKIVIPSVPKNEQNALFRLEQLSSSNSSQKTSVFIPQFPNRLEQHGQLSSISSTSSEDMIQTEKSNPKESPKKKELDIRTHVRLQKTGNISKIECSHITKASRLNRGLNHVKECPQVSSEDSDSVLNYPSSRICISSENGKFTSKVIIRSPPPPPPPRANNTKLSRHHRKLRCNNRPFHRTGSNPLSSTSHVDFLTPPASPSTSSGSSNDYYPCEHAFRRHKSFGSLSASSDESGAWEEQTDPYISHCSIHIPSVLPHSPRKHSTLPRDLKPSISNNTIPAPPPPPPPTSSVVNSPTSTTSLIIPPPPPLPSCDTVPSTTKAAPLSLGAAINKEIQFRQEQEGNGLKKIRNESVDNKKPLAEDPQKHQHDKLMEEFKKAHAMMFSKKRNSDNDKPTTDTSESTNW